MGYEAIQLYKEIPKNLCDEITHICVLNACSHLGFSRQAQDIFNEISVKTTKIVTAMVCFCLIYCVLVTLSFILYQRLIV